MRSQVRSDSLLCPAVGACMPQRVPVLPGDPAIEANKAAWDVFRKWQKPFLTAFSDGDPVSRGGARIFQETIPGAKGQPHTVIKGAGHFLQETHGEELAQVIVDFINATKETQGER